MSGPSDGPSLRQIDNDRLTLQERTRTLSGGFMSKPIEASEGAVATCQHASVTTLASKLSEDVGAYYRPGLHGDIKATVVRLLG
jgi:hypothetical protein